MKKTIFFTLFLVFNFYCFSQDNTKIIDSLKQVISTNPSDSIKIKVYGDLCWYYGRVSNDSAFHYGDLALKLSKKTNNIVGEAQAYNDIGIIHTYTSNYDESIKFYHKSLKIRKILNDSFGLASLYNKLGVSYHKKFQMDSCLKYTIRSLDIYEGINSPRHIFLVKGNVAALYEEMKQYDNALKMHFETLEVSKEVSDSLGLAKVYSNIGNTYLSLNDTIQGLSYYDKSIKISKANNYYRTLSNVYSNYGLIRENQNKNDEALSFYKEAYLLSEKIDDDYGLVNVLLSLGNLNTVNKHYAEAKSKLYEGLNISKKIKSKKHELKAYNLLFYYYSNKINADSIVHYYNRHTQLNDSLFGNRVTEEIAEIQEKYNTAERQKEILTQRADLAEKELNLNRKNTQLIGLVILAIILSVLGYLLYNQQKLKNKQLQKESELKEALIKIETQNRLQNQRLRISRDLHDNIGSQLTFIISSIENLQYGFKIKNEKLTNKLGSISVFTKDTIYELRDTIWAMNKSEITFEDLQTRISNFIDKADLTSHNTTFSFSVGDDVENSIVFTSVEGMNIYRIIQEAVNNAIKYAEAKAINVAISEENNVISIAINDDGIGFDLKSAELGNGLNNIKKRAQDIGANVSITSKIDKGTSIILNV
jgi:signal transduction histidine kinase